MNFHSIKAIVAASDIAFSLDISLDDFLNESDKWTFGDTPHVLVAPFTFERAFYNWFSDRTRLLKSSSRFSMRFWKPKPSLMLHNRF